MNGFYPPGVEENPLCEGRFARVNVGAYANITQL